MAIGGKTPRAMLAGALLAGGETFSTNLPRIGDIRTMMLRAVLGYRPFGADETTAHFSTTTRSTEAPADIVARMRFLLGS